MRRALQIIIILTLTAGSASAQFLVEPRKPYSYVDSRPGYVMINEVTGGFSLGDVKFPYSKSYIGFATIHGYQSDKNFMAGLGIGFNSYEYANIVPVFVYVRYNFSIHPLTPYIFSEAGLHINSNIGANLFINPGIGLMYSLNNKLGIHMGAGYSFLASQTSDSFFSARAGLTYKPVKKIKRRRR